MTSGRQAVSAAAALYPRPFRARTPVGSGFVRDNSLMAFGEPNPRYSWPHARLRRHADYQRVYKDGRKQFSPSMSYFFRLREANELTPAYSGPRVGLTTGRVLGKAVERNRIKRRMREAARRNLALLPEFADVVLHPRRIVLEMEFEKLQREIAKIFSSLAAQAEKAGAQA
jgi:ribonuclease P protein component